MKICVTDHILVVPFSVVQLGKRKLDYPIPIFHYGIGERKNERTVYTTYGGFPFILFSSCKTKNENRYSRSYFYFSFFV